MGWQTTSKGSRAGLQRQALPEASDRLLQVCARITNEPSDWLGKPHHEPSLLYTEAWQSVFFFPKTPPGEYPNTLEDQKNMP